MANLGADFNASKPTEADFVRHLSKPNLATEIRHIRSRLKQFWGELFCLDSNMPTFGMLGGDFQDDVIPSTAFVDHPDKPDSNGEFYTSVTVDRRGFVIKGTTGAKVSTARHFRAAFTSERGWIESENGLSTIAAPPITYWPKKIIGDDRFADPRVAEYRFIVPPKVTSIRVLTTGGGGNGTASTAGVDADSNISGFSVTPGEEYRILVGQAVSPSGFSSMDYNRYSLSSGVNRNVVSTTSGNLDKTRLVDFYRPPYRPYGRGGAVNAPGTPGIVVLEWYA